MELSMLVSRIKVCFFVLKKTQSEGMSPDLLLGRLSSVKKTPLCLTLSGSFMVMESQSPSAWNIPADFSQMARGRRGDLCRKPY